MQLHETLSVADGHVQATTTRPGTLVLELVDWQERIWAIHFHEVLAFKNLGVEGEELAEVIVRDDSPFLTESAGLLGEDASEYRSVRFVSAWTDVAVMEVVCGNWAVEEKPAKS